MTRRGMTQAQVFCVLQFAHSQCPTSARGTTKNEIRKKEKKCWKKIEESRKPEDGAASESAKIASHFHVNSRVVHLAKAIDASQSSDKKNAHAHFEKHERNCQKSRTFDIRVAFFQTLFIFGKKISLHTKIRRRELFLRSAGKTRYFQYLPKSNKHFLPKNHKTRRNRLSYFES